MHGNPSLVILALSILCQDHHDLLSDTVAFIKTEQITKMTTFSVDQSHAQEVCHLINNKNQSSNVIQKGKERPKQGLARKHLTLTE